MKMKNMFTLIKKKAKKRMTKIHNLTKKKIRKKITSLKKSRIQNQIL